MGRPRVHRTGREGAQGCILVGTLSDRSRRVTRLRRLIGITLVILGLSTALAPACALAAKLPAPNLYVPSATLVTSDGDVLWSKNPDAPRRVASTIKLLNALVARDQAPPDKVITVSRAAADIENGTVDLKAGQKLTVRQLLSIMLVHSANDAACALAIGIAGSEKKYVGLMNAKASALGLTHTKAADSNGLAGRERCSAADLAIIAKNVLADPVLRGIVKQTKCVVPRPNGKKETFWTTDALLLDRYPGIEGIKTGFTSPAGYCFVGAAKRNGVELISVVLGASVDNDRFSQTQKLLEWGFAQTKKREIVSAATTMGVVGIDGGMEGTVTVHAAQPLSMTLFDGYGQVTTQVSLPPSVRAPVRLGQELGAVLVSRDGTIVASVPLVADDVVAAAPVTVPVALRSAAAGVWPWLEIAQVWAGLGRMLGI